MCRIAAYQGSSIGLQAFLCDPPHSLYRQSWDAHELVTATVNADGYGLAWLDPHDQTAVYRHTLPIWSDDNLPALQRSLSSRLWLANVRSATERGTHLFNTQPFTDGKLVFVHNGFITDFAHVLRRRLRMTLDEDLEADIQGNTDSEHVFALIRQACRATQDTGAALRSAYEQLRNWLAADGNQALFSMIVADGRALHVLRAAINGDPPSLYFHARHPTLNHGQLVASEAFDDDDGWQAIPPNHILHLMPGEKAHLQPL